MAKCKLVIVGAGPIGLECALRAAKNGFNVTVLERGDVGAAITRWGHVRLFTPFGMNSSEAGRKASAANIDGDAIVSGEEFVDGYLKPLANSESLRGRVLSHHEVIAVSRDEYGKSDRVGQPNRAASAFRMLVRTPQGERIFHADKLIDCTGFISRHRHVGAGGIPCPGEQQLPTQSYSIPDVMGTQRECFSGKHSLVVGSGYSAATSVCALAEVQGVQPETRVTWITRGNRSTPVSDIPNDPLLERAALTNRANALVTQSDSNVKWIAGAFIDSIDNHQDRWHMQLRIPASDGQGRALPLVVDHVIANVGFRPDARPFEELQIHRCYATDGPIKLAAHLLGETSADCLQQISVGPDLLQNPEPNFFIIGAASYGRDSRFLLQIGLKQIGDLFESLKAEAQGRNS